MEDNWYVGNFVRKVVSMVDTYSLRLLVFIDPVELILQCVLGMTIVIWSLTAVPSSWERRVRTILVRTRPQP